MHKTLKGILIEKNRKDFDDGGRGYYCLMVDEKGRFTRFWCRQEHEDEVGEVNDIEGYEPELERTWRVLVREWEGKTKITFDP